MLSDDKQLLITEFFDGALSGNQLLQFEQWLQEDPDFRSEVLLQREVISGLQHFGRQSMRAELAAIYLSIQPHLAEHPYHPSLHPHRIWPKFLKWLLIVPAAAAIYFGYQHRDRLTIPLQKLEEQPQEQQHQPQPQTAPPAMKKRTMTHVDTVWHVIYKSLAKTDTVITNREVYEHINAAPQTRRDTPK